MTASPPDRLSPETLEKLLQQVEPSVLLVPSRILRRVIKKHCGLVGLGLRVPHRKSFILPREDLLGIASASELGVRPDQQLPEVVLLLPSPSDSRLECPTGELLLHYWRLLFHLLVHLEVENLRQAGKLNEVAVRERIKRIGAVEFEEACEVMRQENYLLMPGPGANLRTCWAGDLVAVQEEFVAVYLGLRYFDPHRLQQFFPAFTRFDILEEVLARDIDHAELFRRTRPAGAADPAPAPPPQAEVPETGGDEVETGQPGRLRVRAEQAEQRGNLVRAAILRQRVVPLAPPSQAGSLRAAARQNIEKLVARLQRALHFSERDMPDWSRCLQSLLESAALGIWNREARLLYDLQKVCVDCERDIFAVDLVEWVVSGFRKPIKRLLPYQPMVFTVEHLRTALGRLPAARMPDEARERLGQLLQSAMHEAEHRLRHTLQPKLVAALDAVGLVPANVAERLSRDKVVDELLDRVVESNRLVIGDLRDSLARNRLKLPDLRDPVEFFLGDQLIRLNRRLATDLDGIYQRGEIYLRWMQRLSSLFFGNPIGRFLTLFIALPFGAAYALMAMWEHLLELFAVKPVEPDAEDVVTQATHHINPYALGALGLFFFALIHFPRFRSGVLIALHSVWLGLRALFYDLPAALLALPLVRRIMESRPYLIFYQFIAKPMAWAVLAALPLWLAGTGPYWSLGVGSGVFVLACVLLNSRLGMYLEEVWTDRLARTWHLIRTDLVPGLFRWVLYIFRRLQEQLERIIYRVDEWLRFRSGDSRLSLVVKPILGLVWFVFTYLFRVVFNLFVEPTFNPIKHFPVVTVAAKLLVPVIPSLTTLILAALEPLVGTALALTLAGIAILFIPGFAGFLAWELKEAWRLYKANQSPTIVPEMVGSHGERVIHLVRPGFHAGTLPRLYVRMRRAKGSAERKGEEGLHHVEEELRRFVKRDLADVLPASRGWGLSATVAAGAIHLSTNRIRIELSCPGLGGDAVWLDLANRGGYLTASIPHSGWLATLTEGQRLAFRDILVGFYKEAVLDLLEEQISTFIPPRGEYEISADGLAIWRDIAHSRGALYDLDRPEQAPRPIGPEAKNDHEPLAEGLPGNAKPFLFVQRPLLWSAWVEWWERDQAGEQPPGLLQDVRVLPVAG